MKSKKMFSLLGITMVIGVSVFLTGATSGKADVGQTAPLLEGTWITTVTIPGGPPPFKALHTYSRGGTLLQSNQTDQVPGAIQSPGHGVWKRTGDNQFAFTLVIFQYDDGGNVTGALKVKESLQLIGTDEYRGVGEVELCDQSVSNCFSLGCATTHATRLTVEFPVCE